MRISGHGAESPVSASFKATAARSDTSAFYVKVPVDGLV